MDTILTYHEDTRYIRHRIPSHTLDWKNQPITEKRYPGRPVVQLPEAAFSSENPEPFLSDLMGPQSAVSSCPPLGLEALSDLLTRSCCFTAKSRHGDGWFYFRSTASAGALYPTELYVAAHDVKNLPPGLYHYHPGTRHLTEIRTGNFDPFNADAPLDKTGQGIAATILVTGIFFRSSWKYRRRAYRYVLLDAGHLLANIIFALRSKGVPFSLHEKFIDPTINRFLGVDTQREACLACIHLLGKTKNSDNAITEFDPAGPEILAASRTSRQEQIEQRILDVHRAGEDLEEALETETTVRLPYIGETGVSEKICRSRPLKMELGHPTILMRRRSRRNFVPHPLDNARFQRLMDLLLNFWRSDPSHAENLLQLGILPANIAGYPARVHLLDRHRGNLVPTVAAATSPQVASVCLDQEWLGNAALHLLLFADPLWISHRWGPRGYRYAMLQAGRVGQAFYLAATALGIGCCGIGAFYDDEANRLFCLRANATMLYLLAAGPVKRW